MVSLEMSSRLYLIEILHQTTTVALRRMDSESCILSKFYIKPQLIGKVIVLQGCCILSKFYIKPQLKALPQDNKTRCILSKFYIKPQQSLQMARRDRRCILSKFYIKPQRCAIHEVSLPVVSYRNSTSNHNEEVDAAFVVQLYLIEILHQTTTGGRGPASCGRLYLIEILHQTTTESFSRRSDR